MNFLKYIDLIKKYSNNQYYIRGRLCFEIDNYYVSFWIDENNNYIDGLQFLNKNDLCWTYSNPKDFFSNYIESKLDFNEYSVRIYGEEKLQKPAELRGINRAFSVDYIPQKARCQVFIKDNDVWIKHVDYFSPSLDTLPEDKVANLTGLIDKDLINREKRKKFVYNDYWGGIVLRNEAWICIKNLMIQKNIMSNIDLVNEILHQQEEKSIFKFENLELQNTTMSRFYEKLLVELNRI